MGVLKGIQKLVSKQAEGVITSDNALSIGRRIKDPERQLALAKATGQGVSRINVRNIVKEAARYPGEAIPKIAKFAEIKVASIEKKALRDLTEEDAKAEGGYSLTEFRAFWKETHTVWNPKLKVFLVNFEVQKLAKGGKVK